MNGQKFKELVFPTMVIFLLFCPMVLAQPYQVEVRFWLDKQFNEQYIDETMKVYLQNRTYIPNQFGVFVWNYSCFHDDYNGGLANITVWNTTRYDLIITDGNVNWNNETGCPHRVENYGFWATVQSDLLIDSDKQYDYYINITIQQEAPRQYFWNYINLKMLVSVITFIIILVIVAVIGWKTQSGIVAFIAFLILLGIKVLLGI